MRGIPIGLTTGAFLLFFSTLAYAEPPVGVGAAVTDSGFTCYFTVLVEPGSDTTLQLPLPPPLNLGIVDAPTMENTKFVYSNSANGNQNLACHGRLLPAGSLIEGARDPLTGMPVDNAVVADFDLACDALEIVSPGEVCKGNGAAVLTFETTGTICAISPTGPFTVDWRQIVTRSGSVTITCQAVD